MLIPGQGGEACAGAGDSHRQVQHKPVGAEESSDEELESVSPVDDLSARSNEEHSGASSRCSRVAYSHMWLTVHCVTA